MKTTLDMKEERVCAEESFYRFFAIGDFGNPTPEIRQVAQTMQNYAQENGSPDFILGLGDNFYPYGVDSVHDSQFQTSWTDIFLIHDKLRVPWHIILGNHDYMSNPKAQIEFSSSNRNPNGLWHMPSENYAFRLNSSPDLCVDMFAMDTNGNSLPLSISSRLTQIDRLSRSRSP
jgi:tartrate-resistant acid phosphatase type 5